MDAFPKAANEYEVTPCPERALAAPAVPCRPATEKCDLLPHSSYLVYVSHESKHCVTYTGQLTGEQDPSSCYLLQFICLSPPLLLCYRTGTGFFDSQRGNPSSEQLEEWVTAPY